ncbi:hypothetical protein GCM10010245_72380 [Streptomyces spectabilis]|uniref:Transcriptional regulator WhiB n=1 Tax=Streptomyces spectabilis TaxID=68270 RepID=A0A5P2X2G7_STRST|nr:hypothetical protein [Streptomyces spectabilis]QEV58621.1 WhiB family transcriptional regulator [Streptomyces spectabilis]GGV46159.1 hypothetical protein GCM10010245_72380 [Streptomyces spectabilis]
MRNDTGTTHDWRATAHCRNEDPELFFPNGTTGPWTLRIEQAKAACRRCPVADACLRYALNEGISDGIFGGLTEDERRSLRRSVQRGATAPEQLVDAADRTRAPHRERTLHTIVEDNTIRLFGGHLAWTGSEQTYLGGSRYSPRQAAFVADRGRRPEGPVLTNCGVKECVLPAHLTDQPERGYCGTRNGYLRHRKNGEEACKPCRKANTDADNRLRRTGTTKKKPAA